MVNEIDKISFFRIVALVISVHLTLLAWVFFFGNHPINSFKPERVVVKTISLNNQMERVPVTVESSPPKTVPSKPKAKKITKEPAPTKPKRRRWFKKAPRRQQRQKKMPNCTKALQKFRKTWIKIAHLRRKMKLQR